MVFRMLAMSRFRRFAGRLLAVLSLTVLSLTACGGAGEDGEQVRVRIPPGSGLAAVTDSLDARGVIQWPYAFRMYARMRGADRAIKPGTYDLPRGGSWSYVLDRLVAGDVVTQRFTIPEAWTARQIAERLAAVLELPVDSVTEVLHNPTSAEQFDVPGPTLEGYLYPATYEVPAGSTLNQVLRTMVRTYKRIWTPELRARADSLGMSGREVVTLASIVEAEARVWTERDTIAAVYQNRLRRGMRLQADPTVQYALGERQARLLYAHIDEVADHPYNTYRIPGLPPGPIGSPSRDAIVATLYPADVGFLFFVARPDGTHIFTYTLDQHNAARRQVRRAMEAARQQQQPRAPTGP
jgi:UPF0755 protein